MEQQINPVIQEFMKQYRQNLASYHQLCSTTENRLRLLLEQKGVMAMVSARVKDPDRLEQKLIRRDAQRIAAGLEPYHDALEIFDSVHDMVGARVALYFPGDADRVEQLLSPQFNTVLKKEYPQKAEHYGEMYLAGFTAYKRRRYPGYDSRRFDGYCATHHHVRFADHPVASLPDVIIEIQVASVLMHAWSEVEHDLAYKKLMGEVSREEYECLDELNGLIIAGEIALNRLSQLSHQRIQNIHSFGSQYALAVYLTHWQLQNGYGNRPLGNVELLFDSYRKKDLLTAEYLLRQLARLEKQNWHKNPDPLADQLLDLFTTTKTSSFVTKLVSKAVIDMKGKNSQAPTEKQLNTFQQRWRNLETLVKKALATLGHPTDSRISKLLSIEMEYALTKEFATDFNRLRGIRNLLIQGHLAPSRQEMEALLADIDRLTKFLQTQYDV